MAANFGDYEGRSILIPVEVDTNNSALTNEDISANIFYAQKDSNQTRYNSRDIRAAHLLDLAKQAAEERNCSLESALKQISDVLGATSPGWAMDDDKNQFKIQGDKEERWRTGKGQGLLASTRYFNLPSHHCNMISIERCMRWSY